MKTKCFTIFLLCVLSFFCGAQNAGFTIPDTICEDKPFNITNIQPTSAISYQWSFCTGNASYEPDGLNMGNPNQLLNAPRYIALVKDSLDYYTFTTNAGNASVLRCYYGTSLTQFPLNITNLGTFGTLTDQIGGIQVVKDNGIWYGFIVDGNNLFRLDFGNSPANPPTTKVFNLTGVISASGLAITKDGAMWVGFCNDIGADKLFRIEFMPDISSIPQVTDLGNPAQLSAPTGLTLAKENDAWYAFICNSGSNSLSRINFGVTLLNPAPAGMILPDIDVLILPTAITIINDCGGINGFVTNCVQEADQCIVHLVFKNGLGGIVTAYHIPNSGILNKPYGISDVVRQGDTLFAFVANYGSSSHTRMFFASCSGASQPFYIGPDPPAITYPDPGNYNILLTVDEGGANQSSLCKNIVVMPKPDIALGPDRVFCQGKRTKLDAGAGDSIYIWSTGATTQTILVDTSGTYWVHAINFWNCEADDTIKITVNNTAASTVDTTICQGLTYWAQHALQSSSGIYHDTLQLANGCDSVVTTNLQVEECPLLMWYPNAFTPNGDGLNDVFRPVGVNITKYKLLIFDRWGALIFEASDINTGWDGYIKGQPAGPGVYTYHTTYESLQFPGEMHRDTGTFMLSK
ncbi:MAG: gliding motility-associated C-terminal domain-containing protein [Bacteroidota bacterium]